MSSAAPHLPGGWAELPVRGGAPSPVSWRAPYTWWRGGGAASGNSMLTCSSPSLRESTPPSRAPLATPPVSSSDPSPPGRLSERIRPVRPSSPPQARPADLDLSELGMTQR
jgi:hypothetical protein